MKPESEWDYTLENIKYFVPIEGEVVDIAELKASRIAATEKYKMRDVAIISYAQTKQVRDAGAANDIEMVGGRNDSCHERCRYDIDDVDFVCSGSCDYLGGAAFAFVNAVDALGAVPPKVESHVEMDAAWALYEAWLKIQSGSADTALSTV